MKISIIKLEFRAYRFLCYNHYIHTLSMHFCDLVIIHSYGRYPYEISIFLSSHTPYLFDDWKYLNSTLNITPCSAFDSSRVARPLPRRPLQPSLSMMLLTDSA